LFSDLVMTTSTTKPPKAERGLIEDILLSVLQRFGLFSDNAPQTLQNIANKDLDAQEIEDDLSLAANKGHDQLDEFVEQRLLPHEERKLAFRDSTVGHPAKEQVFDVLFIVRRSNVRCTMWQDNQNEC